MREHLELKDINGFVHIVRAGNLSRASKETNVPKATLSHNLRRLEDALGVELCIRSSKGLTLTDAGRAFLEHCPQIFESCELASSAAQRAHSSIGGKIRLVGNAEFGTTILGAATLYLSQAHSSLEFDVRMYPSDTLIADLPDFDCLIYVGVAPDSDHICRKMGSASYGLYASPVYLEEFGVPKNPNDIRDLPGVRHTRNGIPEDWKLQNGGCELPVEFVPRFNVHDYWMAKYYAVSGAALAYLPDFFVHYEVNIGGLVPVLPESRSESILIWAIYPRSRHKNPRIKLVVDTLCKTFDRFIIHPGYSLIAQDFPGRGNPSELGE